MIKLKNGHEIDYHQDFDIFFQNLLEAIIKESRKSAMKTYVNDQADENLNDSFLKELMDNCIYVTHQLFEIAKKNEEFSRFMVTGFLFNSIILCLPHLEEESPAEDQPGENDKIH